MNEYIIKIIFYDDGKNDNIINFSRTHKCRQWNKLQITMLWILHEFYINLKKN